MNLKSKDNKFPSVMKEIYIRIKTVKATISSVVMVNDERILIGVKKLDDSIMGDSIVGFVVDLPRDLFFPNRKHKIPFKTVKCRELPEDIRNFDAFGGLSMDSKVIVIEKDEVDFFKKNWEGFNKVVFKNGLSMVMRNHPKRVFSVLKKWGYKEK